MIEFLDTAPRVEVADTEYHRLLGYPPEAEPGERARELVTWARNWYAHHGRPWIYAREVTLEFASDALRFDGQPFHSRRLFAHLQRAEARRVMLVAVGAGRACEEHAQALWRQEKPDEYFFLEVFGSAVVEHLLASVSHRLCALAERDGLLAVPSLSPGYAGWNIAEQPALFELLTGRAAATPLPEPVEVLASGMLRPKKCQLAVFGLTARSAAAEAATRLVPCERCSFQPCQYRRKPYRHARNPAAATAAPSPSVERFTSAASAVSS